MKKTPTTADAEPESTAIDRLHKSALPQISYSHCLSRYFFTSSGQILIGNLNNYSRQKQVQINNRIQLAGINVQTQAKRSCPTGTAESTHKKGYHGVSISKSEKCTLSKTKCLADVLLCLPKRIEEKVFEVWSVCFLVKSSLRSVYHDCSSDSTSQCICLAYNIQDWIC